MKRFFSVKDYLQTPKTNTHLFTANTVRRVLRIIADCSESCCASRANWDAVIALGRAHDLAAEALAEHGHEAGGKRADPGAHLLCES